jgi:electron transport complex protein RnfG
MRDGNPLVTLALVGIVAAGAATLVTASWEFGRDRIAANRRARLLEDLHSVLDPEVAGDDLRPVSVTATDSALLGSDDPVEVFIAMRDQRPVAAIFASVAPDGYNAPIYLLIGIDADEGRITGVRVVSHKETPGLGDLIESRKSDWLQQFTGTSLATHPAQAWAVRKDGGRFDAITGATVTPRAVIEAVHNTLLYFDAHRDDLIAKARAEPDASLLDAEESK